MRKMLTIVLLSLTLISFGQKPQPADKDKIQLEKICDTFMKLFTEGKTHDAFSLIKQHSVMSESSIDTLQATVDSQMENVIPQYGKMLAYDFVTEKKIKTFITKRFYVMRLELYYLKFEFTLYKAAAGWTITSFKYDDEIDDLFN